MIPQVIYQDDSILVLDKPSGWITTDADTTTSQPVVQAWLRDNFDYPLIGENDYRDGIVHRIDKETSGILIVAKTKEAFKKLQSEFKQREVKKEYTALVHGRLETSTGDINVPVGRLPWRRDRFGVFPGGRNSETTYKVEKTFKGYSLVTFMPKTGRTHQIRVHTKYLGHPIVGDSFYAGRKTARSDREWCPRLFLHASKIRFIHPITGKTVEFTSKLPRDLMEAVKTLTL